MCRGGGRKRIAPTGLFPYWGFARRAIVACSLFGALVGVDAAEKDSRPVEGGIEPFLGEARMEIRQLFEEGRFPNVVTALDGTVLAFLNGVVVRRSEDGGETWGPEISVGEGFMGGGVVVDEVSGDILAFIEERHPPAPLAARVSRDHGKSWESMAVEIATDGEGRSPSMHMNEAGLTLRHGARRGRLLRPTRHYAEGNDRSQWPRHFTNAIYSDDRGRTWRTSEPFPVMGTGEAAVVELSDGTLYYNSRRHWAPDGENPLRRWIAWSRDGGASWQNAAICEALPDGPQDTNYGCMAGLVRLPIAGRDILVYSNCDSPAGRRLGTVWASFDGGRTWPVKRLVTEGPFAYSSLAAGRPGTRGEGWIYLLHEDKGAGLARFNLDWILHGVTTGDGEIPAEFQRDRTTPSEE